MAKRDYQNKVVALRKKGLSYSQIRDRIPVSKSTLSLWLQNFPLSEKRLRELRDTNPQRIERFRETMRRKRELRSQTKLIEVSRDIGNISKRELFLVGFFLYWAEGTKAQTAEIALANTDPAMIRCFLQWLYLLHIPAEKIKVRLHLYADMNPKKEMAYWSKELLLPLHNFQKPYIKKSRLSEITYKGRFGHGTCNIRVGSQPLSEYILMGVKYLRENVS